MKTSAVGVELIKRFEGFRYKSYLCSAGVCTIGYGHTKNVKPLQTITHEQALKYLAEDISEVEKSLDKLVTVELKQNEYDALVSFVFNVGVGAFSKSTLLRKLNAGDLKSVPNEMRKWVYAGGRMLDGLVKRRNAEADLFIKQEE